MRDPTRPGMTREEGLALGIAIAAHGALIAALTLSPPGKDIQPPPQRMTVTFSEEVADKSTSPDPMAQAAPDVAPQLGEPAPEAAPEPQPAPPQPAPAPPPPQPQPAPQPRPQPPQPAPRPAPAPKPAPRPQPAPPKPALKPQPVPVRPAPAQPAPAKPAPAKPAPAKAAPAKAAAPGNDAPRRRPDAPSGGSRIGSDFLKGIPGSTAPGTSKTPPAQAAGPAVVSSLVSAISRQIKPHWAAPQGVDADKLVTVLAWSLNADGTLAGRPTVVSQSGVTDANRAQAQRHAEQAIRAVQLAAPFDLPAPYYSSWKRVSQFRFDRKLSQ
ncbi:hypothetical protein OLX02_07445 [Novosphingobium sp. KCTC 2891]|uniref:hypothetical protein n=1 Tax=Novosphingobium sp. KCTC 2891 TaxID=2989730 RepID=UPI0022238256|nr:hypothetical protein [Novosphingobium sp. KCTC 2891]MCW1382655.1 hypothetical protein [Novosphingobium sp. KCTC 2891]